MKLDKLEQELADIFNADATDHRREYFKKVMDVIETSKYVVDRLDDDLSRSDLKYIKDNLLNVLTDLEKDL